jgi:hypothetical protein
VIWSRNRNGVNLGILEGLPDINYRFAVLVAPRANLVEALVTSTRVRVSNIGDLDPLDTPKASQV